MGLSYKIRYDEPIAKLKPERGLSLPGRAQKRQLLTRFSYTSLERLILSLFTYICLARVTSAIIRGLKVWWFMYTLLPCLGTKIPCLLRSLLERIVISSSPSPTNFILATSQANKFDPTPFPAKPLILFRLSHPTILSNPFQYEVSRPFPPL